MAKSDNKKWLPIEANPEIFADYANALGGPYSVSAESSISDNEKNSNGNDDESRHKSDEKEKEVSSRCITSNNTSEGVSPTTENRRTINERKKQMLAFEDLIALEDWACNMLNYPSIALIVLFKINEKTEKKRQQQNNSYEYKNYSNVWFTKQTISNACGTIALLHVLSNIDRSYFTFDDEGFLYTFLEKVKEMTPEDRAKALEKDEYLEKAHKRVEHMGHSNVLSPDENVDMHFAVLVPVDGVIYELDGRKNSPIPHGSIGQESFIQKAIEVVKREYLELNEGEVRFQIISVGDAH